MAATIRLFGVEATVEDGVWSCAEASIRERLQSEADTRLPMGYVPDEDAELAREAAERHGGEVLAVDPPEAAPPWRVC